MKPESLTDQLRLLEEEITRLHEKATPGPWHNDGHNLFQLDDGTMIADLYEIDGVSHGETENGSFIAFARTALLELLAVARGLEARCAHLRGALSRETLIQDSYGVHGSDFYTCPFCNAESGAGVLNKGVPHEPECILNGDSDPCESIISMADERDALRHDVAALRAENEGQAKQVANLAMLVSRLSSKDYFGKSEQLRTQAVDYLIRENLLPSPLR